MMAIYQALDDALDTLYSRFVLAVVPEDVEEVLAVVDRRLAVWKREAASV